MSYISEMVDSMKRASEAFPSTVTIPVQCAILYDPNDIVELNSTGQATSYDELKDLTETYLKNVIVKELVYQLGGTIDRFSFVYSVMIDSTTGRGSKVIINIDTWLAHQVHAYATRSA